MSNHLLSSRLIVVSAVVVAAILAAGCGGSSDSDSSSDASPASEWASGLCSAITTWTSAISSIGDSVRGGDLSMDTLTTVVDDARAATETFTSDLEALGKPDTEAGQQAKESIDQLSSAVKDEVATIEESLDEASGVAGILKAVPAVTAALAKMGTEVSSTISDLESLDAKGEFESAFEDSSSCSELMGDG